MIKAILFDVGGTLITPYPSVGYHYSKFAGSQGVNLSLEELNDRFKRIWKQHLPHNTPHSKDQWYRFAKKVFAPDLKLTPKSFSALYNIFRSQKIWKIYPDVVPILKKLKKKRLILAVASNWDERLPGILQKLKLKEFFHTQFISYKVGKRKPDPLFFKHCLSHLNLPAQNVLHVGDTFLLDIKPAKKMGLNTLHIDRKSKQKKRGSIQSLSEIFSKL